MNDVSKQAAAKAMRELSDDDRDRLIQDAGRKVIDRRSLFEERQKQVELSRTYRRPGFHGGPA